MNGVHALSQAKERSGILVVAWYLSLVLTVGVVVGCDLIPAWGKWYSTDLTYRRQVEALENGQLALGTNPAGLNPDIAWTEHGAQQIEGLGVPLWRLPFGLVTRALGGSEFPDRLAFGIFVTLVTFWVIWELMRPLGIRNAKEWGSFVVQHPQKIASMFVLVLFPPFLALCGGRFSQPEETAAYAFLFAIALLAGTVRFARNPAFKLYCALSVGCVLIVLFNPAAIVAGMASLVIAFHFSRTRNWNWYRSLFGPCLFCFCGLAILVVNYCRFGSGIEFGQSLSLNSNNGVMFAQHFSCPFASEPLQSAIKELFALLFFVGKQLNGNDWYKPGFFPGQSSTFRLHEIDFTFCDLTCFAVMAFAWVMSFNWWLRRRHSHIARAPESVVVALWSFLGFLPLFLSHLWQPFVSSVTLMDFAPFIAAGVLSCVWAVGEIERPCALGVLGLRWGAMAIIAGWWVWEVSTAQVIRDPNTVVSRSEMLRLLRRPSNPSQPLPNEYTIGTFRNTGIRVNGLGWNPRSGETGSAAAFFVDNPDFLELTVASRRDTKVLPEEFSRIQAKIGLRKLVLASNQTVSGGHKLLFEFAKNSPRPTGLSVAFLGFVEPKNLTTANSDFLLLGIRWHKDSPPLNLPELLAEAGPEGSKDPYSDNRARTLARAVQAERSAHTASQTPAITNVLPAGVLAFDKEKNVVRVRQGEPEARFEFDFTNISSKALTICAVNSSCGCTTAELPLLPWKVPAHGTGRIPVKMNVIAHVGTVTKTVTITALQGLKTLTVEAIIPPSSQGDRQRHRELAEADRQAVFKSDCARCHADTLQGKTGRDLYEAGCAICHDASPRANMVPDLCSSDSPNDYSYWIPMITLGVPGTLMPAFAKEEGGPLTADQINSLASVLADGLLSEIRMSRASAPDTIKTNGSALN